MVCQIRRFLERDSPEILIGFDSICFDESMLRQVFFQALHPVYQTNTNGNTRLDILRLARTKYGVCGLPRHLRRRYSFAALAGSTGHMGNVG
jgi:exonuclease I